MRPYTGSIVVYRLTRADSRAINARRERSGMPRTPGTFAPTLTYEDQEFPAVVIGAYEQMTEHCARLHVFLDGTEGWYVALAKEGKKPGEWRWPPSQPVLDLVALAADDR